jgi:hypothetical protein
MDTWIEEILFAAEMARGPLALRWIYVAGIPGEALQCLNEIEVPPGTSNEDLAHLLIELLLERAGRSVDSVQRWRDRRGSRPLMERLRARLRVELEGLRLVQLMGLDRGDNGARRDVFLAEFRRRSGLPGEKKGWWWRVREVWYGAFAV